jgi:endoglucanase
MLNELKKFLGIDVLESDDTSNKAALADLHNQLIALVAQVESLKPTPPPITPPQPIPSPAGTVLYVNPHSVVKEFLNTHPTDPNFALLEKIAQQPTGIWLTGGTEAEVYTQVQSVLKDANGKLVTFVIYNIPHRDNGGQSAGGAATQAEYNAWLGSIDAAIKDSGNPLVNIVFEPDALGFAVDGATIDYPTLSVLQIGISILAQNPNRTIYLDVAMWVSDPSNMATAIKFMQTQDGLKGIRGFALNVSGYTSTDICKTYGEKLAADTGLRYIIDTSRNAKGGIPGQWENVPHQGLGEKPLTEVNVGSMDYNLYVKCPGESDGADGGSPAAGQFFYSEAVDLVTNGLI